MSALAAAPLKVVVAPFGSPNSPEAELSSAIELELELNEKIVVNAPGAVVSSLHSPPAEATPEDISAALGADGQDFFVRGVPLNEPGRMLIFVHRASDGGPVFGTAVDVVATTKDPSALALNMGRVFRKDAAVMNPDEVAALMPKPKEADPVTEDPGTGTTSGSDKPEDTTVQRQPDDWDAAVARADEDPKEEEEPSADGDKAPPWARLIRLNAYYAPVLLTYSACQPADGTPSLPFLCAPAANAPPSEAVMAAPIGTGISLRAHPWIPHVGLELDGMFYQGRVKLPVAESGWRTDQGAEIPDDILTINGVQARAGLVGRAMVNLAPVWLGIGGHGGYQLQLNLSQRHYVASEPALNVELLPGYINNMAYVGLNLELGFDPWVRASFDFDVIPITYQIETTSKIAANPLIGAGGHARLQLDLIIAWGLMLSSYVDATATSSSGSGTAVAVGAVVPRDNRGQATFVSGSATIIYATAGLGLGWTF